MTNAVLKKYVILAGASLTWFAVVFQFILMLQYRVAPVPETVIRFFSYFTILSNILVALHFTGLSLEKGKLCSFFRSTSNATAVLLYILVVSIIYNTVLRGIRDLHGADLFVDTLLHSVVPVYMLLYWVLYIPPGGLRAKKALPWLWYPFIYCIYVMIRGAFSGFYPYFFLNVDSLGYAKALLNCFYVTATFLVLALLLIGFSNWLAKIEKR
ncbi:MAG: Pr6Pr family membrane protein [Chitinophagaceae bacterium]|nr:Pr6Pr family membrane protein [Chitinophagaceae bacterium]